MKLKIGVFTVFMILSLGTYGQKTNSKFSDLSGPEKNWVFWHPFKAKKALKISVRTLQITDSIELTGIVGIDRNGGNLDAFKHTLWMVELSGEIGEKPANKLGKAHEKGNYKFYRKGIKEEGSLPDKVSGDMDLFNNSVGLKIARTYPNANESELIQYVLEYLESGELRIIKKDGKVFLTCQGLPINNELLKGKWENEKCLIPSGGVK